MPNPFALAYWCFGGWAIEFAKACNQAMLHSVDDHHAHFLGRRTSR